MDSLPVWELAIIIFVPMSISYGMRTMLEPRYVSRAPQLRRSGRQFRLDFGLFCLAGMSMAFILYFGYGFPLLLSGFKLTFGVITIGLFAGFDLSLERERMAIIHAQKHGGATRPPRELSPMTRQFSLVAILTLLLVTAILLLVLFRDFNWLAAQTVTSKTIGMLSRSVLVEVLFVMGVLMVLVVNLIVSWARNLRLLFENQTDVLARVSRGELDRLVPVTTHDELGYIAGHTNSMIAKLREGLRMQEGLKIAQEVQSNFLPASAPEIPGLDIAGTSLYSDETGGDFYDYIRCDDETCGRMAIMVGDVVGHGVGAALLMASARAMILQGATRPGNAAENIVHANKHLSQDTEGTGRFLTLFFLDIDPILKRMTWVNAGHPPALLYTSDSDSFQRLAENSDIPLGVDGEWQYAEHNLDFLRAGEILLIGTDGIWEAHDVQGRMYGMDRFKQVALRHAKKSAQDILRAIMDSIRHHLGDEPPDDDITLVVIKGTEA